jgi:nitroimidazol reductase NimA-like FMN-containing flavoprotein (pyridoxamine 5'-phosphate oxidase superfamily)
MRRKEFLAEELEEIIDFLNEMSFGILATQGERDYPSTTPLNFVYHNEAIYFHGSRAGQKMKEIKHNAKVTFNVAKEYAIIPSYFTDPLVACPASAFFKSVVIYGTVAPVEDLNEKAKVFTALMQKLQPEGGYEPIDAASPLYAGELKAVSLVRIEIDRMTAKFKFGQNQSEEKRDKVVAGLEQRGLPLDTQTIELMKKYCPAHKE